MTPGSSGQRRLLPFALAAFLLLILATLAADACSPAGPAPSPSQTPLAPAGQKLPGAEYIARYAQPEAACLYPVSHGSSYELAPGRTRTRTSYFLISETGQRVEVPGLGSFYNVYPPAAPTANGILHAARRRGSLCYGYISTRGEWAIPPRFASAGAFYNGYAMVILKIQTPDLEGIIDPWGNVMFEWQYPEMIELPGDEKVVRYVYEPGAEQLPVDILNMQGSLLASGILLDTESLRRSREWDGEPPLCFCEGLLAVSLNGRYGFLNGQGEWAIPPRFERANNFSEGRAAVMLDGKWGYIDLSGRMVIPAVYDQAYDFSEGLAAVGIEVRLEDRQEIQMRFVTPEGDTAFVRGIDHGSFFRGGTGEYTFHDGLCAIYEKGGWRYVDRQGGDPWSVWPSPEDDRLREGGLFFACAFDHGVAQINSIEFGEGYIGTDGQWIWKFVHQRREGAPAPRRPAPCEQRASPWGRHLPRPRKAGRAAAQNNG